MKMCVHSIIFVCFVFVLLRIPETRQNISKIYSSTEWPLELHTVQQTDSQDTIVVHH